MKITWLILALISIALSTSAQPLRLSTLRDDFATYNQIQQFVPKHPWRTINGETNYIKTTGWEFCGQIKDITSDGVRIEGSYGELWSTYNPIKLGLEGYDRGDFFVTNFPFTAETDQYISPKEHLMAWDAGTYTYTTTTGSSRTIHMLDYGIPCDIPPELLQQQAAIAKAKAARDKLHAAMGRTNVFLLRQKQSTNGDVSAQYDLGTYYLTGYGCETNRDLAIKWFKMAAGNGSIEASNKLVAMKIPAGQ